MVNDNKDVKKNNWASVYLKRDTLNELEKLDFKVYWVSLNTSSDKILALINFYKEHNK